MNSGGVGESLPGGVGEILPDGVGDLGETLPDGIGDLGEILPDILPALSGLKWFSDGFSTLTEENIASKSPHWSFSIFVVILVISFARKLKKWCFSLESILVIASNTYLDGEEG